MNKNRVLYAFAVYLAVIIIIAGFLSGCNDFTLSENPGDVNNLFGVNSMCFVYDDL